MKKTISIVVALAMVFVMSFSAFATGEESTTVKPTEPAELGAYYAELLNAEDSDPAAVAAEMLNDLIAFEGDEGLYTVEDLPVVLEAFEENSTDAAKLAAAVAQIVTGLGSLGIVIPDESTTEEESSEDASEDESLEDETTGDGGDTDFLNTILGILGSIGDMIFGGGDDSGSGDGSGDDAWGDDSSAGGSDSDDLVADTGDTTVLSVAAVALVAGAALVLTRKKSDDAE